MTVTLRHLDLFSGIGGFSLAAQMVGGIKTTQFVEIDPYCQKVLAKNFPGIPIHDDITTFTAEPGQFDLITFGSPCQDFSCANPNGKGLEGQRSGLFFEAIRLLRVVRPRFAVFENVANVLTKDGGMHFQRILKALYESGLDAEWQAISAADVGAVHNRERLFVVTYPSGERCIDGRTVNSKYEIPSYEEWYTAQNIKSWHGWECWLESFHSTGDWFESPSRVYRMDDGIPDRVDRIRALGNSVVPQVAAIALQRVLELNEVMA